MSLDVLEKLGFIAETRTIFIEGEITQDTKYRVSIAIQALAQSDEEINIQINSIGGCLVSAFAIIDTIRSVKNTVNGYVCGEAFSAASLILQACDNRYATPLSRIMIHYGGHALPYDTPKNNENLIKHYKELCDDMINIYKGKIKVNGKKIGKKKLDEFMTFDSFFSAKKSKSLNLIDEIEYLKFNKYGKEEDEEESKFSIEDMYKIYVGNNGVELEE